MDTVMMWDISQEEISRPNEDIYVLYLEGEGAAEKYMDMVKEIKEEEGEDIFDSIEKANESIHEKMQGLFVMGDEGRLFYKIDLHDLAFLDKVASITGAYDAAWTNPDFY